MAACTNKDCPYYGERIEVPYAGTAAVDVMVVGESPGSMEEMIKKPFVGKSGDILTALLDSIGMGRSQVFIANSCRCRMNKDVDSIKTQNDAMRACREKLEKAIQLVKPKVIVALGAVALKQLTGKQQILLNRGRVFESEWGIPIVCTVHPAYVLRGAQKDFPDIPRERMQQKERMIFEDFSLVTQVLSKYKAGPRKTGGDGPFFVGTNMSKPGEMIDTTNYLKGTTKDLKTFAKATHVAFDFETTGLDVHAKGFKILSFALSSEEGIARAFTVKNNNLPKELLDILTNPKISKIVASRGYEEKVLRKICGIEMKGPVHDVLVMAHLVDENGNGYNLENLAGIYTPLKRIKDLIGGKENRKERIATADEATLLKYNCVDADATLRLFKVLAGKLGQDSALMRYYQKFTVPVQDMLAQIYLNGCSIDKKALKAAEDALAAQSADLNEKLRALLPAGVRAAHSGNIEWTRRQLIIDTLFSKKGYRLKPMVEFLTPKTREPKVSKEHLQNFLEDVDEGEAEPDHSQFIRMYLEWMNVNKFRSTYLDSLWNVIKDDGKVYPETLINRTVTGRTVLMDPPIQVFPARGPLSKVIKRVFTAGRGWSVIGRDLGQSELRIAAWLSGDPVMLNALRQGIDLHILTAAFANNMTLEEFKQLPPERQKKLRQLAKAINFGFIFGMGAPKFKSYAKNNYGVIVTDEESEMFRNKFFSKNVGYNKLLVFHAAQRAFAHKHGFVRSPIGRKRNLPEISADDYVQRGGAERQAINQPVQSFSTDLGMIGMMLFHRAIQADPKLRGLVKILFFIHDAIYAIAHNKVKKKAMALLKDCMENRAPAYIEQNFGVKVGYPVTSDGQIGPNWGDMEDFVEA